MIIDRNTFIKRIAIASDYKHLDDSENKLIKHALIKAGYDVEIIVWDSNICFDDFDYILIRSCWDYHLKVDAFSKWIELNKNKLINSRQLIIWNLNKKYLLEISEAGVKIPKTYICDSSELKTCISSIVDFSEIIVKPSISASSYKTFKINKIANLDELLNVYSSTVLVQEFLPDINIYGEVSFIFYGKSFSHAVKKIPKSTDFRSQNKYGGELYDFIPSDKMIKIATDVINHVIILSKSIPFYLRIDAIVTDEEFILMEVEGIEPKLFLSENNVDRFVEQFQEYILLN